MKAVAITFALACAAALSSVDLAAQMIARDGCTSSRCPAELFDMELDRMTLSEGPLASDRDAGDLRYLRLLVLESLEDRPEDPRLLLALSEAEWGLGDPLAALGAASRALAAGADSALGLRAQGAARMRLAGGRRDGAALYLAGLGRMTAESAPRFFADLMPILTRAEAEWWHSSDMERRRQWARDYWAHRAARAGVSLEERLAEHMRRSAIAARRFAPPGTGSGAVTQAGVLWRSDHRLLPYDDRGLVYIRRGPPLDEVGRATGGINELPTTTWLYLGVDGSVDAFHFARSMWTGSSYRVVVAPTCGVTPLTRDRPHVEMENWVLQNAATAPDASRAVLNCLSSLDRFSARADASMNSIALRRESMRALRDESPRPPFDEGIPAYFDFFMFRGADGRTQVVTPVVVPVDAGTPQPIDVLVTFADEGGGVARRMSASGSTRTTMTRSIVSSGEGWGVTYVTIPVAATSAATFRVVVRDTRHPERGGMWGGSIEVRDFSGAGLAMSDIVVAGSGPATWSRGDTRLFLLPARSFEPGSTVALFYELYDLGPGTTYRTELRLRRRAESLGGRLWTALTGAGDVRLRFDTQVPDTGADVVQELRSLELPADEGRYELTIRITDADGVSVESSTAVTIAPDAAAPAGTSDVNRTESMSERMEGD